MPSLPFELERQIFELAALRDTDHQHRVRIILVAKRVYEWVRPILYRVAVARLSLGTVTIQNWRRTPLTDVAPFTRHLLSLINTEHNVLELLSTFRHVEDLAIWLGVPMTDQVLEKINDLPLRRLSMDLEPIDLDEAIKNCQAFRNITHLEILALKGSTWKDCNALMKLPRLTHLCFDISTEVEDQAVLDLLKNSTSLRVLIYLLDTEPPYKCSLASDDPRFLIFQDRMSVEDSITEWESSAIGQIGLWELADIILEARNGKLFQDNSSFTFSRRSWMHNLTIDGLQWWSR